MIMFWPNICQDSENHKISNLMYKLSYKLNEKNVYKSPWLNCVKTILEDCGSLGIWGSQVIPCSIRNVLNNKLNKDYSTSLDKNGQQKSIKVANAWTIECLNQILKWNTIWQH